MKRSFFQYENFKEIAVLALPNIINTISLTVMQFVDGLMISMVNKESLAAQMTGSMTSFTLMCFFMGILTSLNSFCSQYFGNKDMANTVKYAWQGIWLSCISIVLWILLIPLSDKIFLLFKHPYEVYVLEITYFKILLMGFVFILISRTLSNFFMGIHRPKINLYASLAGNIVNIIANYILIFGHFGFAPLGIIGAGIGTVIGSAVECFILLFIFFEDPLNNGFNILSVWRIDFKIILNILRVGVPIGLNWFSEVIAWTVFMTIIIGKFGTDYLASSAIIQRYWHICFMPAVGISAAIQAIVGKYIGENNPDIAKIKTYAGLLLASLYMVTMGIIIWYYKEPLVSIFNSNKDVQVQIIAQSLFIYVLICQFFDALGIIFIAALRGAGDTLIPSIIQIILAWLVCVLGSIILMYFKKEWGIHGPWAAATAYIVVLGIISWIRFESIKLHKFKLI